MKSKCEVEGVFNFRHVDLHVIASMDYDRDGYLDITKLYVWSDRRRELVEASERLTTRFQEKKWDFLYGECIDHEVAKVEHYRDMARC